MSIKSQKSLNEECSEIFERSYSVRSASEESLTCTDDEEEPLSRELLRRLTPAALSQLRRCFQRTQRKASAADVDRRVEEVMRAAAAEEGIEFAPAPAQPPPTLCLDEKGFLAAVDKIFGGRKYRPHAKQLFQALDAWGSGRVCWRQLLARLAAAGAASTSTRCERWKPVAVTSVKRLDHCKRETIVKLVSMERQASFCYACVSRGGRVAVCGAALQTLHRYEWPICSYYTNNVRVECWQECRRRFRLIHYANIEIFYHRTGVRRRVKNCWITDAVYMNDVQCLVFSASDRSFSIYDATTITHSLIYCITGLPDIPTCLAYQPALDGGESELMWGSERGDVTRLRFLQPRLSLLYNRTQESTNHYFWMELSSPPHSPYCRVWARRRVHARRVRRVSAARGAVWSCAHDSAAAVRCRHAAGLLEDYVFRVQRGVSCFHVVPALHLLCTGGADGTVRLWETQGSQFASLCAPGAPAVRDVAVISSMEIVVAYYSNCHVHIWDLYEECLLQTIKIKFPFLGVLGKKADFGTVSIHPGPPRGEEAEEQAPNAPAGSRRGSSVYQGSTGGLLLQAAPGPAAWDQRGLDRDPENLRFNRAELLITCCDHVCTLALRASDCPAPPPPGDTLRARRPSFWELPADLIAPPAPALVKIPKPAPASPRLLAPVPAEESLEDLDELLEKAGLQGILEKDFVLMRGLKHDLNKKLHHMETDREASRSAVSAGAPHRALRGSEPEPLPRLERLAEQCARALRKLLDAQSLCEVSICRHSSSVEDFFKFYPDQQWDLHRKYRVLDEKDYTRFLSKRALRREPAFTRQITSLAYKVGKRMFSLAEGMPSEAIFPFTRLELTARAGGKMLFDEEQLATALQYIPSQGLPPLLTELRSWQERLHRPPPLPLPRDVQVTGGAQHGIYQCAELLLDSGDAVVTTEYSYSGVFSVLRPYEPEIIGIPEDENGLIPETLESVLNERLVRGLPMPKMMYLIPTGNNPTGTVLPETRRRRIYELACEYDVLIVEDDPYMFLNYTDKVPPSFLSLDVCGRVVRLDSLSKVVSSGLRSAWITAPAPLVHRLELHMQAEILHPCTLTQAITHRLISDRGAFAAHLAATRGAYRRRRDALGAALAGLGGLLRGAEPRAGLFHWVRVGELRDVYNLVFRTAFERGLLLVPGHAFRPDSRAPCAHLRLTFSKIRLADIAPAVRVLAGAVRTERARAERHRRLATEQ